MILKYLEFLYDFDPSCLPPPPPPPPQKHEALTEHSLPTEIKSTKDSTADFSIGDSTTASPSSSVALKDKIKDAGEVDLGTNDSNAQADVNEYFNSGIRSEGVAERKENDDQTQSDTGIFMLSYFPAFCLPRRMNWLS